MIGIGILIVVFCLLSYGIGKRVYKRAGLSFHSDGEEIIFSIALGLGCLSYLIFILGLSGLLYREVFYLLALILFIILLPEAKNFIKKFPPRVKGFVEELRVYKLTISGFILFSYLSITFLGALAPPTDWDSGVFHLAFPKICAQQHRLTYTSTAYYNISIQMLYLPGLLLKEEISPHLIQWLMSVLITGALYCFTRKYFSIKTGIWAGLIFLTNPIVPTYSMVASIDMSLCFYLFLTIYALFNCLSSNDIKWLWLSGIFCGFSLGIKYSAFVFLIPLVIGFFWKKWLIDRESFLDTTKRMVMFIGIVFLLALPWCLRSYFYTGNPIFPLFNTFWGSVPIPAKAMFSPGIEKTFINYFLFPWHITMIKLKYTGSMSPFSPLLLALIPCLVFFLKGFNRTAKYLIFYCWSVITIFFFLSHITRYMMPILPLLSILAAYTLEKLIRQSNLTKRIMTSIFGLVLGCNFIILGALVHYRLPSAIGLESRDSFLSRRIDIYPACHYINSHPDKFQTILIFDERGYYCDLPYIIGLPIMQTAWVNLNKRGYINPYWIDYRLFKNSDEMLKRFKDLNISHILINFNYIKIDDKSELNRPFLDLFNELQEKQHLESIFSKNNVFLYNIQYR